MWRLAPEIVWLEQRLLLCADGPDDPLSGSPNIGTFPAINGPIGGSTSTTSGTSGTLTASSPLSSVPILNSLPGAPVSLYLDFTGDFESSWGGYSNISTPAYDQDGDPTTFSDAELASIQQIWQGVAEDFSPFNVNVTTVAPSNLNNGVAMKIVIGGNGSWTGGTYGGVSYIGSFTNSIANVSFVFPANLSNGYPKYTGDAVSHESGHAFGLQHQSQYSGTTKINEYYSGPGDGTAPIMGNSYSSPLSRWWYGTSSISSTSYQDDMAVISSSTNGFGYRPDTSGTSASNSIPLAVSGGQVSASGIIESPTDVDYYGFSTGAGTVTLNVTVPAGVNDLVPQMEVLSSDGKTVLATGGPNASYDDSVSVTLPAGNYYVVVASNGGYGNVGQYSVSGTIISTTDTVAAPTNLTAQAVSTSQVNLTWTDNATNETGYSVERSPDGVTWTVLDSALPAGSTSYSDTTASPGTTYTYRVDAYNATMTSPYSNQASATTITVAPGSLTATALSSGEIDLSWGDVTGETGFQIERSIDGINWAVIGTTGTAVTSYRDTTVSASTAYQYRVEATNAGGTSAPSNVASATTPAAPAPPAAPSNLTAVAGSSTQANLTWTDNSGNETGFTIQRSTNGGKSWISIAQVGANITTYTDSTVSPRKTYQYRVYAYDGGGNSPMSNVASITMPRNGSGTGGHAPAFGLSAGDPETFTFSILNGEASLIVPLAGNTPAASAIDQALAQWTSIDTATSRPTKQSGSHN